MGAFIRHAGADGWVFTPSTGQNQDASQSAETDRFAFDAQSTFVYQGHDSFDPPFRAANSLSPAANARETWDVTLFGGVRLWKGAEVWINPEVDQGFGLTNTLGVAGFPSGEAYKVGAAEPYFRVQRVFFRQSIDLPGEVEKVDADLNQLGGSRPVNRVVFTGGKLSVGDIFDTNKYAHDPQGDFLNWSVIDAGSFDYAADAWGYSLLPSEKPSERGRRGDGDCAPEGDADRRRVELQNAQGGEQEQQSGCYGGDGR